MSNINRHLFFLLKPYTLLILILIAAITFHCSQKNESDTSYKVRLGYLEFSSNLPLFVALEKGFFKELGVKVEPVKLVSSNEAFNALLSGSLDGTVGNGLSTIYAIWQNSPGKFKIYLPCVETKDHFVSYLLVRQDSPITDVHELKGKKVGTYTGTSQLMYLKLFLEKFMDPDKDVSIIQVDPNLQAGALAAGQFDALFTLEPYSTVALSKGIAKSLIDNPRVKYLLDPFPSGANSFSLDFLNRHSDLSIKIYDAFVKASKFILDNENESKEILTKYTPLDEKSAQLSNVYEWFPLENESIYLPSLKALSDMMFKFGLLDKAVDVNEMLWHEKQF